MQFADTEGVYDARKIERKLWIVGNERFPRTFLPEFEPSTVSGRRNHAHEFAITLIAEKSAERRTDFGWINQWSTPHNGKNIRRRR